MSVTDKTPRERALSVSGRASRRRCASGAKQTNDHPDRVSLTPCSPATGFAPRTSGHMNAPARSLARSA
jgi:hypothetical protein